MTSAACNSSLRTPVEPSTAAAVSVAPSRPGKTYAQILKSSAWIGGSSVVTVAFGVLRTKALALMLGPSGVGVMGLFTSIADVTRSFAGMGVNGSGVRQIAEAVGSGDVDRIARTAAVLRRVSILLGLFGAAILLIFRKQASLLTFGTDERSGSVALLSLAVFFTLISAGQTAHIQGMRRIADLARLRVLGALLGAVASIALVYFLREEGVVPSLIAVAAMSVLTSWWFSRKLKVRAPSLSLAEIAREVAALLKLGLAFMASGFMLMGVAYCVRVIVLHRVGFEAVGMYQAAWGLSTLYVGFILQAMGDDFYPRLTALAGDNAACNQTVNEQAHVSMLFAGPGILATITFAPIVMTLFYSPKFVAAAEILQWFCLGIALQVVSWPMGYIVLAKGAHKWFLATDFAWTLVHVGLAWLLVNAFGGNGAGMAFFGSYLFHVATIYPVARRLSGFGWSSENRNTAALFLSSIAIVFVGFHLLSSLLATILGAVITIAVGVYSLRTLVGLVGSGRLPARVRGLLVKTRLLPAAASIA
jgi:PST family polysaccharide transporter